MSLRQLDSIENHYTLKRESREIKEGKNRCAGRIISSAPRNKSNKSIKTIVESSIKKHCALQKKAREIKRSKNGFKGKIISSVPSNKKNRSENNSVKTSIRNISTTASSDTMGRDINPNFSEFSGEKVRPNSLSPSEEISLKSGRTLEGAFRADWKQMSHPSDTKDLCSQENISSKKVDKFTFEDKIELPQTHVDIPDNQNGIHDATMMLGMEIYRVVDGITNWASEQLKNPSLNNNAKELLNAFANNGDLLEVVNNCFDSVVESNIKAKLENNTSPKKSIDIKLSIRSSNDKNALLKFKDNGAGYPNLPKGERKTYEKPKVSHPSTKRSENPHQNFLMGGIGKGFKNFVGEMEKTLNLSEEPGLPVSFKNRAKNPGVSIEFSH